MKHFVALCLSRPIATLTVHIILLAMGLLALDRLPLNSTPESERPRIRVSIPYPNATPEQVELEVTRKVEEALSTLRGVLNLSSEAESGEGSVRAEFAWGTDIDQVKLEVRERLARMKHELPTEDLERIRIRGAWGDGDAVIRGRISAKGIDLSQNYELLVNRLQRPLERIDGVAQVEMDGVTPLEIQVSFRQDDLDRHGVEVQALVQRIQDNNVDKTIGEVIVDRKLRRVRLVNAFRGLEDVKAFPVLETGLRLEQVADVTMQEGEIRFGRHLNRRFAVSIEVFKESTANTVEVCRRVLDRVEQMKTDPQLSGVDLLVWEDQGDMIVDALAGLKNAGLIGSSFALLILFFFLRRFTATGLVGMAIPISVLATLAFLYLLGRELNILTLVALMLGVGMLVDTAVVVVESIVRLNSDGHDVRDSSVRGTMEVATPILAATITSIIVFIPVAFGQPSGMTDYIKELGLVISLTLSCSLFVSLTLIPMASARIYRPGEVDPGRWFRPWQDRYERFLGKVLGNRALTLGVIAIVLISAVVPWLAVEHEFDDVDERTQNVGVFYTPDTSLDFVAMEQYVNEVEAALFEHKDEVGFSDVYSWYKDSFAWTAVYPVDRNAGDDEMAALRMRVEKVLPTLPGMKIRTGDWGMFWGGGSRRSSGTMQVRFFGDSSVTLQALLTDLEASLLSVPGVTSVERRMRDSMDEIAVAPEADKLSRLGMSSQQLGSFVQAGYSNRTLREIRQPNGEVRLRVSLQEDERDSLPELRDLPVPVRGASDLPLAELSKINERRAPGELRRHNRQSALSLSVMYDPADEDRTKSAVKSTLAAYDWPKGYAWDLGRDWRRQRSNQETFWGGVLLAVFLVYVVMACLFESLLQPLILLLTVPLALPGVYWFLFATGSKFDLPAAIGLILLVGIVVNNGIVMIDHMNRYRESAGSIREAVLRGGRERLRPVLITALTTIIGLLPLAFGAAKAANIHYHTLARTIIGGLALSTILTLVVVPVVYSLVVRRRSPVSVQT
ncbi:MAG: efflux RND transporter permease subunit [Planctomycetota bacterium]